MLRIGCLGAARIVPLALVQPSRGSNDVFLQIVGARDGARAQVFARDHGFAEGCAGYEAVVAHPEVDLVYVTLPVSEHAAWSIRALEAGKHVLCEKPFAMNGAEARAVLDDAAKNGRRVIEAFHYRYHPAFATMLDWIAAGRIGRVVRIDAEFSVPIVDKDAQEIRHRPTLGGGAFMDLGCYPLNWALALVDAPLADVRAEATLTPSSVDETMHATLSFGGGESVALQSSMAAGAGLRARLQIEGNTGVIDFVNPLAPQIGASLTLNSQGESESAVIGSGTTYAYQLAAVASALTTGSKLPTEGDAILRQQDALDAVYRAAGLGYLRANPPVMGGQARSL